MRMFSIGLAVLVVLSLLLAGCAPRPGGGATAANAGPDEIVVDLPSLVIDFDEMGAGSIAGVSVGELMGGDGVELPAETVQDMMANNIQHLQLDAHPAGITLRVNGLPMLGSMAYDPERLGSLVELLESLAASPMLSMLSDLTPVISALVPMIDNLGVGLVAMFPVAAGHEPIPLMVAWDDATPSVADVLMADIRQEPRVNIPISVAADGSLSSGELDLGALIASLGSDAEVSLPEDTVSMLASSGIESVEISTTAAGLAVAVNGLDLPLLTWNQGEFENIQALVILAGNEGLVELMDLVGNLLPFLQVVDANLSLQLPDMADATAG